MADYDLLWSTMTRYHGGLGGGDGYNTELPDGWKENQSRIADKVPSRLKCPISGELIDDPVVAADGFSYERSYITEWFRRGHTTSPLTGAPLPSTVLTPNQNLRQLIMEFKERHSALERRWGRVRFMRARLDEAEALAGSLSHNKANVALRREVDTLRATNRSLEEQVVLLMQELANVQSPRRMSNISDDDEEYGFPPSDDEHEEWADVPLVNMDHRLETLQEDDREDGGEM
mmetsp:Transcript_145442/g.205932  ORF Transcript_145442/g.205932 Transcript_145442/m.205932 type:complete len:232 (+) Transcript_145442:310-1005(+)